MLFAKIGRSRIWQSEKQKLLGVTIDKDIKSEEHIVSNVKKLDKNLALWQELVTF